MNFSNTGPGPFGLPKQVPLACFEAYVCHGYTLYVPETLKVEPLREPKELQSGPKMCLSAFCSRTNWDAKADGLAHLEAIFGLFGRFVRPENFGKAKNA